MSRQSRKGDRREREWADLNGGVKLSRKGYEGPDVATPPLRLNRVFTRWEVKSKEDLPKWLADWMGQMGRYGNVPLVFRQNRKPWFMLVRVDPATDLEEVDPLD